MLLTEAESNFKVTSQTYFKQTFISDRMSILTFHHCWEVLVCNRWIIHAQNFQLFHCQHQLHILSSNLLSQKCLSYFMQIFLPSICQLRHEHLFSVTNVLTYIATEKENNPFSTNYSCFLNFIKHLMMNYHLQLPKWELLSDVACSMCTALYLPLEGSSTLTLSGKCPNEWCGGVKSHLLIKQMIRQASHKLPKYFIYHLMQFFSL